MLLFMLLIHPFMIYVLLGYPLVADGPWLATLYARHITSGRVFSGNVPMWFALALLLFCAAVALVRIWKPNQAAAQNLPASAPGSAALLGFGATLMVSTFLVRIVQPLGTNVLNFQLCFFPQYIAAFLVGGAAGKHGWLEALATSRPARIAG